MFMSPPDDDRLYLEAAVTVACVASIAQQRGSPRGNASRNLQLVTQGDREWLEHSDFRPRYAFRA
jgi:hypothetical protein